MAHSIVSPVHPDPAAALPATRQIWPSAIPAHAIFTPPPSEQDERWLNDIHLGLEVATAGQASRS